jgi:hypothetical protein
LNSAQPFAGGFVVSMTIWYESVGFSGSLCEVTSGAISLSFFVFAAVDRPPVLL